MPHRASCAGACDEDITLNEFKTYQTCKRKKTQASLWLEITPVCLIWQKTEDPPSHLHSAKDPPLDLGLEESMTLCDVYHEGPTSGYVIMEISKKKSIEEIEDQEDIEQEGPTEPKFY